MFLRQVDNFAISIQDKKLADSLLDILDSDSKQKLKHQELLSSFNGLDVHQSSLHQNILQIVFNQNPKRT